MLANPLLKPELHEEFELGFEGSFFDKRLSLDMSLYKRISTDQIVEAERTAEIGAFRENKGSLRQAKNIKERKHLRKTLLFSIKLHHQTRTRGKKKIFKRRPDQSE